VNQLEREPLGARWSSRLALGPEVLAYRERLKTKAVSSPTYEAVSRPLYPSAGRWRNYRKYIEPCLFVLAPCIKAFGCAGS
jgi:hypothetical protein